MKTRIPAAQDTLNFFLYCAWLRQITLCVALLTHIAAALSQTTQKGSIDELKTHLQEDRLSAEDLAAAIAQALRIQADDSVQWDTRRGDFLQLAREKGKLSDDQWRAYLSGAMRVTIRVGTQVKRSAGLPIMIEHESARTGRNRPAVKAIGTQKHDLSGIRLQPISSVKGSMNLASGGGSGFGWTEELTDERYASLKPGPQTYHYRYDIEITSTAGSGGKAPETIGRHVIEGTIPWRLLAESETRALPALQPDPDLRPAIEKGLSVNYVLRGERDKTLCQVMIQVDKPPTGMAFDMSLRVGGDNWPLGPVGWAKDRIGWWAFDLDLPEEIQNVSVVLTPSAQAAVTLAESEDRHRLSDLEAIWDGTEIVISGIKIKSQRIGMIDVRPPTKPAAIAYALAQMDPADPVVQRWKSDGDIARARAQFEQRIAAKPAETAAHYGLGCLLTADDDLTGAMKCFVEAQRTKPAPSMGRQIQRQLRRICAMWLHLADKEKAANPPAMTALGTAYEHGWGVGADPQEAKRWYRNAANAGHAEGMRRLASFYERKTGATVQTGQSDEWYRAQALEWYRKAAALGNAEAKRWITTNDRQVIISSESGNARPARSVSSATASGVEPATETPDYQQWVSRFTTKSFVGSTFNPAAPLKLRITAVEGDEPTPEDATRFGSKQVEYGTTVTADGHVASFRHSSRGTRGGGGGAPLPAETLARLDELLSKLPDDGGRLPPPNRRLLLQTDLGGVITARVYDRANAPAAIWEILRLSRCSIGSHVLRFKPASQIEARGFEHGGFLRLTPDGKQLLFTGLNQPLQFWEPATHELLREVRGLDSGAITFSPDGSQAVVSHYGDLQVVDARTWKFTRKELAGGLPQFTPDGRHLLLQTRDGLRAVETTTWKFVDLPAEIPPDTMRYMPAPGNKRAVVQLKSGAVTLWDVTERRVITTLRDNAQLLDAAFSPDKSQIAVQTDHTGRTRSAASFGIWRADNGAPVHELRPFERDGHERSQGLLWTPDGNYLLAGTMPDSSSTHVVSVFNARTGKHRAVFDECYRINGVVLLPGASQLVVGCEDGNIRFWDFPSAMKRIREFEDSLSPLPPP